MEKKRNRNDKEHHEKASFSYTWVFEWFLFYFIFEKTSSSLPVLFVHVGKRSSETLRSSRSAMYFKIGRSSHRSCSVKRDVLRNFAKFAGKHLCKGLFLNKVAGLKKKRPWHRYLPANFVKLLRTPFLRNTCGRLPLNRCS